MTYKLNINGGYHTAYINFCRWLYENKTPQSRMGDALDAGLKRYNAKLYTGNLLWEIWFQDEADAVRFMLEWS